MSIIMQPNAQQSSPPPDRKPTLGSIEAARQFWERRGTRPPTPEYARQIIENVTSFFGVLAGWEASSGLPGAAPPNQSESELA
jgi:hypothetical protein